MRAITSRASSKRSSQDRTSTLIQLASGVSSTCSNQRAAPRFEIGAPRPVRVFARAISHSASQLKASYARRARGGRATRRTRLPAAAPRTIWTIGSSGNGSPMTPTARIVPTVATNDAISEIGSGPMLSGARTVWATMPTRREPGWPGGADGEGSG